MSDLRTGWTVVGNDGRRIGTVKDVGQNYVLTSRSAFSADLFIPVTSIANVEEGVIHLNLTQPDAERMGWEQEPRGGDTPDSDPDGDLHRHI